MSLASMNSYAGEEGELHGLLASTMFPRLEAQLREAEKGFTSTLLKFCPDRAVMEQELLGRAKTTNEVRKIHGFHVICPIVCLPNEVLVKNILRRLDPVSLCRVSMTCTFLYELAGDNVLWRRLYDEWERKWEVVSRKTLTFGVYVSDGELLFAGSDDEDDDDDDGGDSDGSADEGESSDERDNGQSRSDSDELGGQREYEETKEDDDDDDDEDEGDDESERTVSDDSDELQQGNASEEADRADHMEIDDQHAARSHIRIGSNRSPNTLRKEQGTKTKAKAKTKTKSKSKAKAKTKARAPVSLKTHVTRANAPLTAAALINSSPAGGPHSGKTVSFTTFSNTSASDVPLKRKGSAISSAASMRRSKEFESALAMAAVADNYSNPPVRVPAMMTREESDGERREREKMVHDMQREWRRTLDRVARHEAQDERAHAFYWKHCFREMEIRALNRKKKDVSTRKSGVLNKLLARAGTNLFLQAVVFPLPLKWLMAKETADAMRDTRQPSASSTTPSAARSPRGAGQRRGSLSAAAAAAAAADASQRCVSPFRPIVRKVFENNKRLLSLRNQFEYGDEDAQNRPGNLPPNEEWIHFGGMREVNGGDDLLRIVFSVRGEVKDVNRQRAMTLNFIKEMRAMLGGEIEGIWEDLDFGFGGGDSHRLVVFSTPGRKGLLLQWSWENNSNLLQPWHQ